MPSSNLRFHTTLALTLRGAILLLTAEGCTTPAPSDPPRASPSSPGDRATDGGGGTPDGGNDATTTLDARTSDGSDCNDVCEQDAMRCRDGGSATCELQPDGCLAWAEGGPCDDDASVDAGPQATCSDACTADVARCEEGFIERCMPGADGCTAWKSESVCAGGVCADAVDCGFPVGGEVRGLRGELTLQLDPAGTVTLAADGSFTFPNGLPDGASYRGTVAAHPEGQQCAVWNARGTVQSSVAASMRVVCHGQPLGNLQKPVLLKAPALSERDKFGTALASDGNTLVVGVPYEDGSAQSTDTSPDDLEPEAGAVYVFVREGGSWRQQAALKASNAERYDLFGQAVAIRGDWLAVGAYGEAGDSAGVGGDADRNGLFYAGAVYLFHRQGSTWTERAYVKSPRPAGSTLFGFSVALGSTTGSAADVDLLFVGAPYDSGFLSGSDGEYEGAQPRAAVSQSGSVLIYGREGDSWRALGDLVASNRAPDEGFGMALSLDGDTLAVAAPRELGAGSGASANPMQKGAVETGAVYVFEREQGAWLERAYLKASNPGGDLFGLSLSLSGDLLAVGAAQEDGDPSSDGSSTGSNEAALEAGAVYVYSREQGDWTGPRYLKPRANGAGDNFGSSVHLRGTTLVVGARGEASSGTGTTANEEDDAASGAGAVYVFDRSQGEWSQSAFLKGPASDPGDGLGVSVTTLGNAVIAGVSDESSSGPAPIGDPFDDSVPAAGGVLVFESCNAGDASCVACDNACAWEGQLRCDASELTTCVAGPDGCLDWGAPSACISGACADERSCVRCDFECVPDAALCQLGQLGTCAAQQPACFAQANAQACSDAVCFDSSHCAATSFVQWGSTGADQVRDLVTLEDGTTYVLGLTDGVIDGANLGGRDLFLTKLDASGNLVWQRQWGGTLDDEPGGLVVDAALGVAVASAMAQDLGAQGSRYDLCLTHFDHDGAEQWQTCPLGLDDDYLTDMVRATDGHLIVTGYTVMAGGVSHAFVEKRDAANGNARWRTWLFTQRSEKSASLAVLDDAIYAIGTTEGDLAGTGVNPSGTDVFVAKLQDSPGLGQNATLDWIVTHPSPGFDLAGDIALDASGDAYVVGSAPRDASSTRTDAFLWKLAAEDGSTTWIQHWGGPETEQGRAVVVSPAGELFAASTTNDSPTGNDVVLTRWSTAGLLLDDRSFTTLGSDDARALSATSDAIHLLGHTSGSFVASPNAGAEDAFLLSLRP